MRTMTLFLIIYLLGNALNCQDIKALYENEEYQAVIKSDLTLDKLTGEECYMVGYSFYRLEDDVSAVKWYDHAIDKGLDDDNIYFYKGLSLRFAGNMDSALENFNRAVSRKPDSQRNLVELGNTYFYLEDFEQALKYLSESRALPYELGMPYYQVPYVFHYNQDFEKALEEYYVSAELIDKSDPVYLEILKEIGVLEYTVTENNQAAINAYKEVLKISPKSYEIYSKLIKCYNRINEIQTADSLFNAYKIMFDAGTLPEDLMSETTIAIDEFMWNNRMVVSFKSLVEPKETLDEYYSAYLLDEKGESIEVKFMTEKTLDLEPGINRQLMCSKDKDGSHNTYPYGWNSLDIKYDEFKNLVLKILNEEIAAGASSRFKKE